MLRLDKLIRESECKLEALPTEYFLEYFEREFLPQVKKINIDLQKKCSELADTLPVAEFQNELKHII